MLLKRKQHSIEENGTNCTTASVILYKANSNGLIYFPPTFYKYLFYASKRTKIPRSSRKWFDNCTFGSTCKWKNFFGFSIFYF